MVKISWFKGNSVVTVQRILFALNLGLTIRLVLAYANYFGTEERLKSWVNRTLRLHPHADLGANVAFLILSLVLAGFIFLILVGGSKLRLITVHIQIIAGIITAATLPFCFTYRTILYSRAPGEPRAPIALLVTESVIMGSVIVLTGIYKSTIKAWLFQASIPRSFLTVGVAIPWYCIFLAGIVPTYISHNSVSFPIGVGTCNQEFSAATF